MSWPLPLRTITFSNTTARSPSARRRTGWPSRRLLAEWVDQARRGEIALLCTDERMFTACGKLYAAGLSGGVGERLS